MQYGNIVSVNKVEVLLKDLLVARLLVTSTTDPRVVLENYSSTPTHGQRALLASAQDVNQASIARVLLLELLAELEYSMLGSSMISLIHAQLP